MIICSKVGNTLEWIEARIFCGSRTDEEIMEESGDIFAVTVASGREGYVNEMRGFGGTVQ